VDTNYCPQGSLLEKPLRVYRPDFSTFDKPARLPFPARMQDAATIIKTLDACRRADIMLKQERWEEAAEALESVAEDLCLSPTEYLAELWLRLGHWDRAAAAMARADSLRKDTEYDITGSSPPGTRQP
jgi:hypothetical protein